MRDELFVDHFELEKQYKAEQQRAKEKPGRERLKFVGLTLEDLNKHDVVWDLGAGEGYIARAARAADSPSNVVSMDILLPSKEFRDLNLPFYQFDLTQAKQWPDASVVGKPTLAISKQGPLFIAKKESAAREFLQTVLNRLDVSGELRVYPARFNFKMLELFGDNAEFWRIKNLDLKQLLRSEENNEINLHANQATAEWLGENKFKYHSRIIQDFKGPSANREYLILTR